MSTCILIGSSETLAGDFASPEMRPYLPLYALLGAVTGLLATEILLRPSGRALRSGFFTRYAATVLGVCVGGALSGALFSLTNSVVFSDFSSGVAAYWILLDVFYFGVYAGLFGLFEGLLVGIPLAAILGMLAGREASLR